MASPSESGLLPWLQNRAAAISGNPAELATLRESLDKVVTLAPLDHEAAAVRGRAVIEGLVREMVRRQTGGAARPRPVRQAALALTPEEAP